MGEPSNSASPAGRRRVLFVDDDLQFLETVRELMSVLSEGNWEVLGAESASRAFAVLQTQPTDLVVIDVQMSVMDGIQMLSLLNRGYPNVQKVVLTGHASEKYRAACLSNGADLFLEKPTDSSGWQSLYGVLSELVKFRPEEGFRGVLRRVGLQDVIQMECLARSSSVLEVSNAHTSGSIYIETGQIIHAQVGEVAGEHAFTRLMSLGGGQFNLRAFTEPPARSLSGPWEFLLMEAARTSDELKHASRPPPSAAEVAHPEATPAEEAVNPASSTLPDSPAGSSVLAPLPEQRTVQPAPPLPAGVPSRPVIQELLICSAQGDVLYEWQCQDAVLWVNFFEFLSHRGQRLAQTLPLGGFDRLEVESGGERAVVIISPERGVLVKSRREALHPKPTP